MLISFRFCMRAVKIPLLICLCFYQSSNQQSRTSYAPSSIPRPSMSAVVSIFKWLKNFSLILPTFLFVLKVKPVAHGSQNLAVGTTPSSKENTFFKQVFTFSLDCKLAYRDERSYSHAQRVYSSAGRWGYSSKTEVNLHYFRALLMVLFHSNQVLAYLYSRASMSIMQSQAAKPKETRNLNDKNCVQEMIKNIVEFLNHQGFPEYVSTKEIQKMDKQSFVKYFNVSSSAFYI